MPVPFYAYELLTIKYDGSTSTKNAAPEVFKVA